MEYDKDCNVLNTPIPKTHFTAIRTGNYFLLKPSYHGDKTDEYDQRLPWVIDGLSDLWDLLLFTERLITDTYVGSEQAKIIMRRYEKQ